MKNKVGRPTVITKETLAKLEYAFLKGCPDTEACLYANISVDALYDYQKKYPEFTKRKALLKENPTLIARFAVVDELPNDPELALKYLERKNKNEFSLRQEVTGTDGGPMQIQNIEFLITDDTSNKTNEEAGGIIENSDTKPS